MVFYRELLLVLNLDGANRFMKSIIAFQIAIKCQKSNFWGYIQQIAGSLVKTSGNYF